MTWRHVNMTRSSQTFKRFAIIGEEYVILRGYGMRKVDFLFSLMLFASSCGQKSVIKTHVEARALGDGEHITFSIVVPLSEKSISSFKSPVADMNPLARGFVGSIMNLGASMGAGKQRLTLIQPIPEIPESFGSVKIKRIFFYIEPEKKKENFDFLRKLALKVSSTTIERDNPSWEPIVDTDSMDDDELSFFWSQFPSQRNRRAREWEEKTNGLMLIKYDQESKEKSLKGDEVGKIQIIQTRTPNATRKYLENNFSNYLTRIHTLSKSILVELKNDPIAAELFKTRFSADSQKLSDLGIGEINLCDPSVCLDMQLPDEDLIPILKTGNALKIDTYIDPKKAPKSFQLKGFLEFELKVKSKL